MPSVAIAREAPSRPISSSWAPRAEQRAAAMRGMLVITLRASQRVESSRQAAISACRSRALLSLPAESSSGKQGRVLPPASSTRGTKELSARALLSPNAEPDPRKTRFAKLPPRAITKCYRQCLLDGQISCQARDKNFSPAGPTSQERVLASRRMTVSDGEMIDILLEFLAST